MEFKIPWWIYKIPKEVLPDLENKNISDIEVFYKNTGENEIIEELEKYGFSFKFAQDKEGSYYALLSVKQEVLDRIIK